MSERTGCLNAHARESKEKEGQKGRERELESKKKEDWNQVEQ